MKKKLHILIPVLVLIVAASAATDTQAGLFGRNKDKEKTGTWRFHRSPTMGFTAGTLSRDGISGWELNGMRIILAKDCQTVGTAGGTYNLREGDQVMVMGPRAGNTIVAWQIRRLTPNGGTAAPGSGEMVEWSEVDRSVGEISGPS